MLLNLDQREYAKLNDKAYALEKRRLQIELLKLQEDVIRNKRRICIVFEGRDTAGRAQQLSFLHSILFQRILIMSN